MKIKIQIDCKWKTKMRKTMGIKGSYMLFLESMYITHREANKKNHSFCSLVSKMYYNWVFVGVCLSEKNNFDMKAEIKDV